MQLSITYPQPEINRINAEYEAQQRNISRLEFARTICGIYSEKSEAGQVSDGKKFVELLTGVLK
jgi:hypothetical protein